MYAVNSFSAGGTRGLAKFAEKYVFLAEHIVRSCFLKRQEAANVAYWEINPHGIFRMLAYKQYMKG